MMNFVISVRSGLQKKPQPDGLQGDSRYLTVKRPAFPRVLR